MASVTVLYFASLRDAAGREREAVHHDGDLPSLYASLQARHGFALPQAQSAAVSPRQTKSLRATAPA